jgi:hypothetical protein
MRVDILLNTKSLMLKFYALLAVLESAVAFYYLASIPTDSENVMVGGFSSGRLLLLTCVAVPFIVFGLIFTAISVSPICLNQGIFFTDNFLGVKRKRIFVVAFSCMLVCLNILFLLMPHGGLGDFAAIGERLAPLVYLGGFLGAQTLLGQFFWRNQQLYFQNLRQWKPIFWTATLLFALVSMVSIWVSWSRIGLKPETYGWHTPGTPITLPQLLIALFFSLLFMLFRIRNKAWHLTLWGKRKFSFKFETFVFFVLWLTAFLVWQGEPMRKQTYFTPAPTAPNFEYYPYSDAGFYDTTSQSILIGEGRNLKVILRPLYIFFLTTSHLIGGQNYNTIIAIQTLCLAFMPALVFLLVSRLGNYQSAGVLAAILVIFREKNSIALTNIIEVSHSKLLLSDLPTMAFTLLFVYALVNWLRKTNTDYPLGIVAGASFGLVMLVRSQAQLLLPILLVGIVFSGGFQWRKIIQRVLIFTLGLFIVITPWVWRNYQVSGKPAIENTEFYLRLFASGYSEPTDVRDILPGESFDEYSVRIKSQIIRYIFNHPVKIARVYSTYFIHNEISSVIYLPMSLRFYDLYSYVKSLPFWDDPYINLANGYGVLFFLNLGLIILGIAVAFDRLKFLGLFPLLIHLTYSFSVVTARISGWRFVLPVDWILQIYYSIGLIQLVVIIASVVWNKNLAVDTADNGLQNGTVHSPFFQGKTYLAMAGFLLIGLFLPMIELAMPVRYPSLSQNELIETYAVDNLQLDGGGQITASALKKFLETEPAATVLYGRALYPSYYEQGNFWGDSNSALMVAKQFDRLQFTLIGPVQSFAFIPLQDAPKYFPHASDVFVVGCKQGDFIKALIVKVDSRLLSYSPWNGLTCSETK